VHIIPKEDSNTLTIDIISNGHHIKKSEVDKIFNFGFRGEVAQEELGGNGVGLSICKQIIKAACKKHGEKAVALNLNIILTEGHVSPK
jgi:signal transduction histidine kinase